jgi:hypothetical protein
LHKLINLNLVFRTGAVTKLNSFVTALSKSIIILYHALIITELISVDLWGIWVNPQKIDDENWNVPAETTLRNDTMLPARDKIIINQTMSIVNPLLWDIDSPNLYSLNTGIVSDGKLKDAYRVKPLQMKLVETTGPAAALKLRLEDEGVRADNEDIAIRTVLNICL